MVRDDMFKVIVERSRRVNSNAYSRDGRRYPNSENAPAFLGMKRGYDDSKWLNENLAPLKRYLEHQGNRPWDKVYSEIRATIDPRDTVKQHILHHLDDFVAIRTKWEESKRGGQVLVKSSTWSGKYVPLNECDYKLFVHPRTGILLRNRLYIPYSERYRQSRRPGRDVQAARRRISDRVQLHCLDGIWHGVGLKELPPGREILDGTSMAIEYKKDAGMRCRRFGYRADPGKPMAA